MFAYVKGSLEEISSAYVVVDVQGIGYKIFMSNMSINDIGELGQIVKIHTHYYVREDNISLYGFLTKEELKMFELLLSVSGIGAKTAVAMLSNIEPSAFAMAVISNDVNTIKKIPGIGPKSAQRIILELKDKLKTEEIIEETESHVKVVKINENVNEAIEALLILGYNRKEVQNVYDKLEVDGLSTEELIKLGLKNLAR